MLEDFNILSHITSTWKTHKLYEEKGSTDSLDKESKSKWNTEHAQASERTIQAKIISIQVPLLTKKNKTIFTESWKASDSPETAAKAMLTEGWDFPLDIQKKTEYRETQVVRLLCIIGWPCFHNMFSTSSNKYFYVQWVWNISTLLFKRLVACYINLWFKEEKNKNLQ